MSARDANSRLSRRIREARPAYDKLAPFRPATHSELPQWPADAFDEPRWLERITIPPGNQSQLVCDNWPECECRGDCDDAPRRLTEEQRVLLVVLAVIGVSGLGLLYLVVR